MGTSCPSFFMCTTQTKASDRKYTEKSGFAMIHNNFLAIVMFL